MNGSATSSVDWGHAQPGVGAPSGLRRWALDWGERAGPRAWLGKLAVDDRSGRVCRGGDRAAGLRPFPPARQRTRLLADAGADRQRLRADVRDDPQAVGCPPAGAREQAQRPGDRPADATPAESRHPGGAGNARRRAGAGAARAGRPPGLQRPPRLRRGGRGPAPLRAEPGRHRGAARGNGLPERRQPARRAGARRRPAAGRDRPRGHGLAARGGRKRGDRPLLRRGRDSPGGGGPGARLPDRQSTARRAQSSASTDRRGARPTRC